MTNNFTNKNNLDHSNRSVDNNKVCDRLDKLKKSINTGRGMETNAISDIVDYIRDLERRVSLIESK